MPECVSSSHTVGTRQRRQTVGVMTLMPNCTPPMLLSIWHKLTLQQYIKQHTLFYNWAGIQRMVAFINR